jgi:hypothetical protein
MASNAYSYGSLGERWTVGDPTSKDRLDTARVKNDANRWTLEALVTDPDTTAGTPAALTLFNGTLGTTQSLGNDTAKVATTAFVKAAVDASTTAPGGTNTQVQYNNSGAFGGSATFTFATPTLTLFGPAGTGSASSSVLNLSTNELTVVDGDYLGRIDFQAPIATPDTDSRVVAAAIHAEADATFSSSVNTTDLVFSTATSGAVAERVRISDGGLTTTGTLNATGDTAAGDDAAMGYASADGLVLTGQGSTNDVTIKNDADADVIIIPTGTQYVGVGPMPQTPWSQLCVAGIKGSSSDPTAYGIAVHDTTSMAEGVGGVLMFNGNQTGTTLTTGAAIHAYKENGTAGNTSFSMCFNTRVNGSTNTEKMRINSIGNVFIQDTYTDFAFGGLIINQLTSDSEILSLKSLGDVAHSMTDLTEADTYGFIRKSEADSGGMDLCGVTEASRAIMLRGSVTVEVTSDTSSTYGAVRLNGEKWNGSTGTTALGSTGVIMSVDSAGTTRMLLKGDGTMHIANTTLVALDDEDDIGLVRAFQKASSKGVGLVMSKWDEVMKENEDDLRRVGVLSSESDFVIQQNFNSLIGGSVWQLYTKLQETKELYEDKIAALESRLMRLEA